MLQVLEEKIKVDKYYGFLFVNDLAKVLVRFPKSDIIREYLMKCIVKSSKRLSYNELNLSTFAIRKTNIDKEEYLQFEN